LRWSTVDGVTGLGGLPHGEGDAFLSVKGLRDVVSGLVMLAVLAKGSRRTLGWPSRSPRSGTCSSC
jgi:hypothetical protein